VQNIKSTLSGQERVLFCMLLKTGIEETVAHLSKVLAHSRKKYLLSTL